ncbi:hypothetical protein CCYA_CCYA14G3826 [Cyanidiococcus yangmingshanensis]|nr:hypothetical protein CCYA_CCYA14G3826 [Cyanidiococcus yangmingshanensis]
MAHRVQLESRNEDTTSSWDSAHPAASSNEEPTASAAGSHSPLEFGLDLHAVWGADAYSESGRWLASSDAERWSTRVSSDRRGMTSTTQPRSLHKPPTCGTDSGTKAAPRWSSSQPDQDIAGWQGREPRRPGSVQRPVSGHEGIAAPSSPPEHVSGVGSMPAQSAPTSPFYPRSPISSSSSSLATAASTSSPSGSLVCGERRVGQPSNTSLNPNNGSSNGAGGVIPSGAAAQAANRPGVYPCREGAPDCLHYLKTGRCQFGARCKFNHPPRDARLIDSLNRRDCFDWVMTGSCPYGTSCKYNHPVLNATERPMQLHQVSGAVGVSGRDPRRRPELDRGVTDTTATWGSNAHVRRSEDFHRADSAVSVGSVPPGSPNEISWLLPSPSEEPSLEKRVGSWPSATETRGDPLMWSPSNLGAPGSRGHSALKPFNAAPGTPVHRPLVPPSTRSPQTSLPSDASTQGLMCMLSEAAFATTTSAASSVHSPKTSMPGTGAGTFKAPSAPNLPHISDHARSQPGTNVNAMPFASSPILSNTWTAPGYLSGAQRQATETLRGWNDEVAHWPSLGGRDIARPSSDTNDAMYRLAREQHDWNASVWTANETKLLASSSSTTTWTTGRTPNDAELTAGWLDGLSPPLRASTAPSSSPTTRPEMTRERTSASASTTTTRYPSVPPESSIERR